MPREPEIRSIIKREVHISFTILKFLFYYKILNLIVLRYNRRIREVQNIPITRAFHEKLIFYHYQN